MENIYISDLDGTLLNSQGSLSDKTRKGIQKIVESNIPFTVATARSVVSVQKKLEGVELQWPVIEFNGAFISDLKSGEHLAIHPLEKEIAGELLESFITRGWSPFVSGYDGSNDRLYYRSADNEGALWYIRDREKSRDPRLKKSADLRQGISQGQTICLTVIDRFERLEGEFERLQSLRGIEVHLQENSYSQGWYWLTVHSAKATKDKAIQDLVAGKTSGPCRITVFGDSSNDLKMLKMADCGIAVANGKEEVKRIADKIIPSNDEDGVIEYILKEENLR